MMFRLALLLCSQLVLGSGLLFLQQASSKKSQLHQDTAHQKNREVFAELTQVDMYKDAHEGGVVLTRGAPAGSSRTHEPPPTKADVGCFARQPHDATADVNLFDKTCQSWTRAEKCRSGLPFYRLKLRRRQTGLDCFAFCLSKGLDLSGIVMPEHECRCGASDSLTALWSGAGERHIGNLKLPVRNASEAGATCGILVSKYEGAYEAGSVPLKFAMALTEDDNEYIASVVLGSDVIDDDPEYGSAATQEATLESNYTEADAPFVLARTSQGQLHVGEASHAEARGAPSRSISLRAQSTSRTVPERCFDKYPDDSGLSDDGEPLSCDEARNGDYGNLCQHADFGESVRSRCEASCGVCTPSNGAYPSCYPDNCGAGGGPWLTKDSHGIVRIRYFFDDSGSAAVDDARKAAFRDAVLGWKHKTCIFLEETDDQTARPAIAVKVLEETKCYATGPHGPGYPGSDGVTDINLGWCHTQQHVGNMMHEIGHAIGMNHEQKRADASGHVDGNGPFLVIHWDNIAESSVSQWLPDSKSYVGSANIGGYNSYDYGSIMQYSRGQGAETWPAYDTVDAAYEDEVGQRTHLSPGDVAQTLDMYQCQSPPSWPDKSPTKYASVSGKLTCQQVLEGSYGLTCNDWEVVRECPASCGFEPVCEDSAITGFHDDDGNPLSCADLADRCLDAIEGSLVMRVCPLTCEHQWPSGYSRHGVTQTCEMMTHMCSSSKTPDVADNCKCSCYLGGR